MNDRESQLWKRCILVLYIIKKLEFFTLFSREKEWNLKCFHLFREWKVKWECLEIEIENEKWNEKALKSRSRVKSEMKMPRDRDREVKFLENSREILKDQEIKKNYQTFTPEYNKKLFLNQYFSWQNAKLHAQFHSFFSRKGVKSKMLSLFSRNEKWN